MSSNLKYADFIKAHSSKIMALSFWLLLLLSYGLYSYQTGLGPLESLQALMDFLAESFWGPLIFLLIYTLRPLVLFSATLLTLAAGILFGPVWGIIYSLIGSNAGASLAFFIGRFLGQGAQASADSTIGRYVERMRRNSFETIFIMRLMFLPYDLVNYLAGFMKVSFPAFLSATALGSLPGTISFVLFGASAGDLRSGRPSFDWRIFLISLGIFLLSLAVSRFLRRREGGKRV